MRHLFYILAPALMMGLMSAPASAQQAPDYGAIIRDIIKSVPQNPVITTPQTGQAQAIPLSVNFDMPPNIDGARLIVSALAPDNGLLGESRIILNGLQPPLSLSLFVPPQSQNSDGYIVLKARIDDANGETQMATSSDTIYTNGEAIMRLSPVQSAAGSTGPITAFNVARGTVSLKADGGLFQDAKLTVQLVEAGLAGGQGSLVKGETVILITDSARPIPFEMNYGTPRGGFKMPLGLKAFVTDWAGRVTHVMPNRAAFDGPDKTYRLSLDRILTGAEVQPFEFSEPPSPEPPSPEPPSTEPSSPELNEPSDFETETIIPAVETPPAVAQPALIILSGDSRFSATRGLPRGSVLTVELWQRMAGVDNAVMSRRAIVLDGLSGDVAFTLPPARPMTDPNRTEPELWLGGNITAQDGTVLFTTSGQQVVSDSPRLLLFPTSSY